MNNPEGIKALVAKWRIDRHPDPHTDAWTLGYLRAKKECADELESLTAVAGDAKVVGGCEFPDCGRDGNRNGGAPGCCKDPKPALWVCPESLARLPETGGGIPAGSYSERYGRTQPLYATPTRQAVEGMVPEGWRVIPFGGSFGRGKWEVYAPCGSGGAVDEDDVRHFAVRMLLDTLAAAAPQAGKGEAS